MNRLLIALCCSAPVLAQEDLPEGHSSHGEVFNDGPRQAAYLMSGQARVHFPVTCSGLEPQQFFDQGVGQLHGFWYFEAERSFRQVAALDPDCAMAYWGMAMANVDNEDRAAGFARVAWLKRGLVDDRERQFIDSLARFHEVQGAENPKRLKEQDEEKRKKEEEARKKRRKSRAVRLAKDYENILWDYPDDIEAKAFLVNRLWLNGRLGSSITSRQANEALLQQILDVAPMHPVHHYRIHLWDAQDSAGRVIEAAINSGLSAPGVAHMWHMGGHIFDRLGRHDDAAWQQEASARVDHAHMMRDHVLPDQIHNYAHNNEWLVRSLRQQGRIREAVDLAKNMIELPRHPKYNTLEKGGGSASYGRRRLLETLELFEQWEDLITLSETMYLEPPYQGKEATADRAERLFLLAKAHAYVRDDAGYEQHLAALSAAIGSAKVDRVEALEKAEEEGLEAEWKDSEVRAAMDKVLDEHQRILDDLRDKHEALVALQAALRAELSGEELKETIALLRKRRFDKAHLALLCLDAADAEQALELARDAVQGKGSHVYPQAVLAHVLNVTGKREEALDVFDQLRERCARADIDLPAFKRLAPLAEARGLPADWRPAVQAAPDVGQRVDLNTLGPLRWSPPPAPGFRLPDGFEGEVSLADYEGRPVLVIFFLGFGCVHCVEQLKAFKPAAAAFEAAGIDIVSIGTDSIEQLNDSQAADTKHTAYPFPILADPQWVEFRRWRSHDDFEGAALHGTFLIDGEGRIRWQDISYEPFMQAEFLLAESVRLLGLPDAGAPAERLPSTQPSGE
jgi:peroxiredoxin